MISRSTTPASACARLVKLNSGTQHGYALLVVLFFVALLAVSVATVAPVLLTQARRDKEDEMIWRGKQYERSIKLFYKRNHRIPTSIEELTAPKLGVRYLRKAYKDPMNEVDGSWRMIYVGPAGQLIGSTRPSVVFQLGVPGMGTTNSQTDSTSQSGRNVFRSQDGGDGFGIQDSGNASGTTYQTAASTSSFSQTASSPSVFGASLIGVGSKVDRNSIRWLDGAKNYLQFEFIWDPSKDGMGVNPIKLLTAPAADSGQPPQTSPLGQSNPSGATPQVPSNPQ